jgi:hypothetical protein
MARTVSGVSFIVDLDAVLATPAMRSLTQLIDSATFRSSQSCELLPAGPMIR